MGFTPISTDDNQEQSNQASFNETITNRKLLFEGAVKNPSIDVGRGFLKGLQRTAQPIASVSDFIGVPEDKNIFKISQASVGNLIDELPKTPEGPGRFVNELIGETPGIAAEFMQGGAAFKALGGQTLLSKFLPPGSVQSFKTAGDIAATEALSNLEQGFPDALEAAKRGALTGLAFPVASQGLGLLSKGLKESARKMVAVATSSTKIADDFINNPFKFSLRFFDKKVKSVKEAREVNRQLEQQLTDKQRAQRDIFQKEQRAVKSQSVENQRLANETLSARVKESKDSLKTANAEKIDNVRKSTAEALSGHREKTAQTLDDELKSVFDEANALRKYEGEMVGEAIEGLVAIDPAAGIPVKVVKQSLRPILKDAERRGILKLRKADIPSSGILDEFGQAIPSSGQRITTRTEAITSGQASRSTRVNKFLSDIDRLKINNNQVSLEVLQALKNDASRIAEQSFRNGDGATGSLFSNISKEINPAAIASKNPNISSATKKLAEVNARFSKQIKPYNEIKDLITTTDSNGNVIATPMKVVSAVRNNDTATINRLRKIDAGLPKESQILPKIREHNTRIDRAVTEQKAQVKLAQKHANEAERSLEAKNRKLTKNSSMEQRKESSVLKEEQIASLSAQAKAQREQLRQYQQELADEITFLESQDVMRAFQGKGASGLLQRIFSFGSVMQPVIGAGDFGTSFLVGGTAAAALSPNILGRTAQAGKATLDPLLKSSRSVVFRDILPKGVVSQTQ